KVFPYSAMLQLYFRVFRPTTPALCAVAFFIAGFATDSHELVRVGYGLCVSVVTALVYLLAMRALPMLTVLAISLFLDEAIIAWLVSQLSEPEALSIAFLWSVVLGGLFLPLWMLGAVTAVAATLSVVVPLVGDHSTHPELLIANVLIFMVIAAAMTFTRRQERLTASRLARSERQLAEAQRVAHIGSYLWNPRTRALDWSDEMFRIWGAERGEMQPSYAYLDQVDPGERDAVMAEVAYAVEHRSTYDADLRLRQPDGSIRIVRAQGDWTEEAGEPVMVGTVQDVTQLRHVQEMQREFVATASHELRTPATIIGGFAETLERQWARLDDAQRLAMVAQIRQGATRLTGLIEDVLHVTRIEHRQIKFNPRSFPLDRLVGRVALELQDERIDVSRCEPTLAEGDPDRLRQVVSNLLENALRYADSKVVVQVAEADGFAHVAVHDDGIGIPEHDRARVFDRFVRLAPPTRANSPGTGLGLYIARQLVELGGGSLDVGDSQLGGARFWFTVPLADAAAAE
ncbi:MAG: hypothetical protein JWN41_1151, partial [Thermoleophilia bacterium]|nr:hypothetical protein [Thermoleophilia bacterium]